MLTRHGNRVGAMLYGTAVDTVMPATSGAHACAAPDAAHARAGRGEPQAGGTALADLLRTARPT